MKDSKNYQAMKSTVGLFSLSGTFPKLPFSNVFEKCRWCDIKKNITEQKRNLEKISKGSYFS